MPQSWGHVLHVSCPSHVSFPQDSGHCPQSSGQVEQDSPNSQASLPHTGPGWPPEPLEPPVEEPLEPAVEEPPDPPVEEPPDPPVPDSGQRPASAPFCPASHHSVGRSTSLNAVHPTPRPVQMSIQGSSRRTERHRAIEQVYSPGPIARNVPTSEKRWMDSQRMPATRSRLGRGDPLLSMVSPWCRRDATGHF